jgi:hypothetical protein
MVRVGGRGFCDRSLTWDRAWASGSEGCGCCNSGGGGGRGVSGLPPVVVVGKCGWVAAVDLDGWGGFCSGTMSSSPAAMLEVEDLIPKCDDPGRFAMVRKVGRHLARR